MVKRSSVVSRASLERIKRELKEGKKCIIVDEEFKIISRKAFEEIRPYIEEMRKWRAKSLQSQTLIMR